MQSGLKDCGLETIDWMSGETLTFEFKPPGSSRPYLAVAEPVRIGQDADRRDRDREAEDRHRAPRAELVLRLAIAGALGLLVAGLLAWYLSRTIVRPVLALSRAADEVAGGNYAVEIPEGGAGEIGHLAERFDQMTERLAETEQRERNFLMSVSHELRTPLTAIRGHVSALLEGVVEDPEQRTLSLEVVEAESRRLERLVGDILDLAKLDAHRFTVRREEVDMEQLVEQAYETFSDEARRRSIDYSVDVRDRPVIVSDGDRVLQIVDNLLSNAFRATPDGGPDHARARTSERADPRRGRGHRPRHPAREARAAVPRLRLGGRRHGPRAHDREGAVVGARRPDRPRVRGRPRLAVRARAPRELGRDEPPKPPRPKRTWP